MEELKEKIARFLYCQNAGEYVNDPNLVEWELLNTLSKEYWYQDAAHVIALFQTHLEEQLEGLKVIGDEQIWSIRATSVHLGVTDIRQEFRDVARAQLEDIKKQLRREK